ncbi:MAG: protein kinase [Candidatus Velthaea sp.]
MLELAGRTLAGRYRIEALVGRGGMADVYRGNDTVLERAVAIKILTERSDDIRKRFLREAQSMARLNHRNVVAVYDAGQGDGLSYIVMELVEGRTLAQIPADELTMHRAIRFFIDLLEALAYAHEQNVIHRDVKPANVMVLPDGTIKVMDFGLSRRTSEMSSVTNAGEIVGTIAYLSPERFLGKVADARSDLYSVGVVMYEIFTGAVPFKSETDDLVAVIFAHVNEPAPPMRGANRAVPVQVERIVMKLLEKDPDKRYQTARDLIRELQALIGAPGGAAAGAGGRPLPAAPAPRAPTATESAVRDVLDRTFGSTTTLNEGYSNTLAGMLATRKRDYPEAIRAYTAALAAFSNVKNHLEHAKTALKYATMILQKNSESDRPDRKEIEDAVDVLTSALPVIRGRRMHKELEEGERVLYALQRTGVRFR